MDRSETTQQKFRAQLERWSAEIDRLEAKARESQADAKLRYLDEVEALRASRQQAREKLEELQRAGEKASGDLLEGARRAWHDLGEAVKAAGKRFG